MRVLSLAILVGFALIALPAAAQNARTSYGSYTCSQQVQCSDDGSIDPAQWAAVGNACMLSGFGYSLPAGGLFDESAGLNGSNCLTSKPGAFFNATHLRVIPQCCVVKLPTNACVIHCDLIQE